MLSARWDSGEEGSAEGHMCMACLTRGRRTGPLGRHTDTYGMLLSSSASLVMEPELLALVRVCWECRALLGRITRFRTQVLSVTLLLQSSEVIHETRNISLSLLREQSKMGADYIWQHQDDARPEDAPPPPPRPAEGLPEPGRSDEDSSGSDGGEPRTRRSRRLIRRKIKLEDEEEYVPRKRGKVGRTKRAPTAVRQTKPPPAKSDGIITVQITHEELVRAREEQRHREDYANKLFRCESCIMSFSTEPVLEQHNRTKHSEAAGAHECGVCRVRYPSAELLAPHRAAHYTLHACRCGFTRSSLRQVAQHHRSEHEPQREHHCKDCAKTFKTQRMLRYHRECDHKAALVCQHCSKPFNNSGTLKRHLLQHTGMPMYECSICHKSYRGQHGLRAHMRTHPTGVPTDDAFCADCNMQFKHKYLYRHHLKSNPKHAPPEKLRFPCSHCEKRFFIPSALKMHTDTVHLRKTPHKCDKCQKGYGTIYRLKNHIKFVHERARLEKKHVCETCGQRFYTRQQMTRHLPTHTGERPYTCDICGATFRQTAALYTHRRLVHLKLKSKDL